MNDHPSDIIVDHTGLTLTFVYNQRISIWEYHSGWKGLTWKEEGKADVSCTITDSAAWTSSGATNVLSLVFPGGPKLLNTTCNPVDRSIWEKIASGDGPGVPDGWKYLKVTISPLSLNFGGLDYFLATNLLFPGEHVFNADPITTGLHIPRDTLITGNLHKPSATLQSRGLLRGGQSTKTSVTALVERFLAPAGGPILGDYLSALGSTENQMENVEAFLSKYNIDDWTGDELSYITGQRYNSNSTAVSTDNRKVPLLQYEQGLPNIGAVSEEPSFDIRLYGAWYKIDAPFTMKDGDLLVNPQTGKITVQSIETTPTVTEKDGTHTVSFTAGGNSFTMVFDSNIDSSTGNFKLSFTGKVKYPSGSSEDFKGKQYTPAPGDAGLGSGFAKTINILALVGFGVGVFGCLGILQSYLYRREDKKNAIETPEAKARRELTERNNATVKTQLETIHRLMTEMAASRAAQIDPSVSSRLSDSVESVVESSVRESSSAVDFSDLSGESSLASPPFDSILDRSNSAARSEIELQVHANQLAPVVDSLAGWRHSAFLSVAEQRQIAQDAVTPVVQAAQLRLEQSGFVRQKALSVMLDEHAKQQEQRKREKQTELDNLALEASRTAIEQAAAEIAEKRAADKLAAETDPNKKEEEQAALERERADVAKIKDEAERQREAIAARERERDEAARKEKEIEEAREKAERAAEEAKKREEE
ncbi:hypothetical protein QFC19_003689 [Naganishia cerealis]|uniref:Uncharacterized protein n=1 Tax=Naganishia cerealis TaxID=610337 RepID=A0ACC2W1T1_9TREE|nr:hypothetical protein QFC19_003689 [Naganishia cerealis]